MAHMSKTIKVTIAFIFIVAFWVYFFSPYIFRKKALDERSNNNWSNGTQIQTSAPSIIPEIRKSRLPNTIIAGFPKCGTRALNDFLLLNPLVQSADHEIHFFDEDGNYDKGLEWYKSQFPPRFEHEIGLEKTPDYALIESAMERMRKMNQSLKLICIVCDPVARAVSQYSQLREKNPALNASFQQFILNRKGVVDGRKSLVLHGIYVIHVGHLLDRFDMSQIHFVDGDSFRTNPYPELRKVEDFLSIEHFIRLDQIVFNSTKGFYCMRIDKGDRTDTKCLGSKKGRRHVDVDPDLLKTLRDFYRPYNKMFIDQVGRQFTLEKKSV